MDTNHTSNTAYEVDNYSMVKFDNYSQHLGIGSADSKPVSWTDFTMGHACYTSDKVNVLRINQQQQHHCTISSFL
jgi:hypothetical protein